MDGPGFRPAGRRDDYHPLAEGGVPSPGRKDEMDL